MQISCKNRRVGDTFNDVYYEYLNICQNILLDLVPESYSLHIIIFHPFF